ncbi:DUF3604 domain-containing protein [Pseudoteredinibacter isoporae]|uniref:DUF3604 domain-containing protein n=1 Tax=Pseudoteredinibacter isoporae TaxID=570281 RepID=A0A7X0MWJ0_9GAMM|nr:DUF3604 domain-containing protein [Pseudoteredinibacter isoporae]MBB6522225.1 hypothetical protein [Pseudoteredinibacter isoporae]NHO87759.1 DUF3604 domain-containing protein [Pseudoteredinibacter isoporae]NIB23910.1 DUF3604 domain-containing protein [Pseudoteredinibacter isoporae]
MKQVISASLLSVAVPLSAMESGAEEPVLLWGDTHVHSKLSFDSFLNGNLSAGPDTAYRWAKGEPVIHPYTKARVQIHRPLDFMVVADHAEFMGVIEYAYRSDEHYEPMSFWGSLKRSVLTWLLRYKIGRGEGHEIESENQPKPPVNPGGDPVTDPNNEAPSGFFGDTKKMEFNAWKEVVSAAEKHNKPGHFSAIIGWEWSSTPSGNNLHRVVITPDGADKALQYLPFGSDQSQYPEDLWQWLDKTAEETQSSFVAIPHNPNLSNGFMFPDHRIDGREMDARYIEQRRLWEPVTEITQFKGDSETHPDLSPKDPFADFERYNFIIQQGADDSSYQANVGSFARPALKRGLELEQKYGGNPFKFGFIGSSDSHTALSSTEENNFHGKMVRDSTPENKPDTGIDGRVSGWSMSAQGLAAVWARENSRTAILDAFKRREVYASTGTRIRLRFFAGSDLSDLDSLAGEHLDTAYRLAVPMGGDLLWDKTEASPDFIVHAVRDMESAGLDRVQIIKGWLDANGHSHEKIFNVAWYGERELEENGELSSLPARVDMSTGRFDKNWGSDELFVHWKDPDFNPNEKAFYYVRVLEAPTMRHSQFDALALGRKKANSEPALIQERAYSSPIWFTPAP